MLDSDTQRYRGILKMFRGIDNTCNYEYYYNTDDEYLKMLRNEYSLDKVVGEGNTFVKLIKLTSWLYSLLLHDPLYENKKTDTAYTLLKRLKNGQSINCRAVALIFVELCFSLGIKAQTYWLLPFSPYDNDCHVVPVAFCDNFNKWVMFDATVNSIVLNNDGVPLSPLEIRHEICEGNNLFFSETLKFYRFNRTFSSQCQGFYRYLSKNVFFFKTYKINSKGYEYIDNQEIIYLFPNDFPLKSRLEEANAFWNNKVHI